MNAHANNFVVVNEAHFFERSKGRVSAGAGVVDAEALTGSVLAPLDFDMAYTRSTCNFGNMIHHVNSCFKSYNSD
jgi:hypothetical protein